MQRQDTTRFLFGPARRLREHVREIRRLAGETRELVAAAHAESAAQLSALGASLAQLEDLANRQAEVCAELSSRLAALASEWQAASPPSRAEYQQLVGILWFVNERGHWRRRQLRRLRSEPVYERAFSEPEPLISVVIPTYDNYASLRERSIPSVLAQTYQNFEIVVVGDAAPDDARRAVEGFGDPRITFFNLPYRGPYPEDPETRWLVAGVPAYNEAVGRARGLWIAPLDDDDAFRPAHLERLMERARLERLELTYSRMCVHLADGDQDTNGRFPPEYGQFGVQSALYHAGLADIFDYALSDAAFGLANDWGLCRRMMEAGVRIGMLDEETVDYYPSTIWTPRW